VPLRKESFSGKRTIVVPESARFKPGPTEAKTEKDRFTYGELTGEGATKQPRFGH